ncbi:MAG: hypothetical protein E3J72_03980 [Planctomycetota bacterium]|nr:MAG: hypothetical protein E3J72_03980 [Planctomycetota bacterium]
MRYAYLMAIFLVLLGSGCVSELHVRSLHVESQMVAESSDRYAVRHMLDMTNRLKKWTDPLPLRSEHLYTVSVSKLPDRKPHVEIRVYDSYTRLTFFNDPANREDDEKIDLITSGALTDALADIGEYKPPEKPGE